uniref:C2H2-type domain-containing protein n=1 Tax=Schizaphis graminum TaxID=13262 RepID=A0A2S2PBV7_SCHGA
MTTKKNQKKSQKRTKQKKKYCDICCRNYSCYTSFKAHMKYFHGQSNLNTNASSESGSIFQSKLYFSEQKQARDEIRKADKQKYNKVYLNLTNDYNNISHRKIIRRIIDENHIKALNEICVVKQPFDCIFCNAICNEFDHYQFQQWWSLGDN